MSITCKDCGKEFEEKQDWASDALAMEVNSNYSRWQCKSCQEDFIKSNRCELCNDKLGHNYGSNGHKLCSDCHDKRLKDYQEEYEKSRHRYPFICRKCGSEQYEISNDTNYCKDCNESNVSFRKDGWCDDISDIQDKYKDLRL